MYLLFNNVKYIGNFIIVRFCIIVEYIYILRVGFFFNFWGGKFKRLLWKEKRIKGEFFFVNDYSFIAFGLY